MHRFLSLTRRHPLLTLVPKKMVQEGMDRLMEGRTVFVIAHRLSTIVNSDVIMVMDHGRIIERGDHDSLMEQGGTLTTDSILVVLKLINIKKNSGFA